MSKHTQGPWYHLRSRRGEFIVVQEPGLQGKTVVKPGDDYNCYGTIENEADARLIAAAPELLEALQGLLEEAHSASKGLHVNSVWSQKARAVITKATTGE